VQNNAEHKPRRVSRRRRKSPVEQRPTRPSLPNAGHALPLAPAPVEAPESLEQDLKLPGKPPAPAPAGRPARLGHEQIARPGENLKHGPSEVGGVGEHDAAAARELRRKPLSSRGVRNAGLRDLDGQRQAALNIVDKVKLEARAPVVGGGSGAVDYEQLAGAREPPSRFLGPAG